MKVSELIKELQYSMDEYGDLPVSISIARSRPELLDIIKKNIEANVGSDNTGLANCTLATIIDHKRTAEQTLTFVTSHTN